MDGAGEGAEDGAQPGSSATLIAPLWHTVVLLVVVLGVSFIGSRTLGHADFHPRSVHGVSTRLLLYGQTIVGQWAMVGWIYWGIRKRGVTLRTLVGGRWTSWQSVVRDLGLAILFFVGSASVLGALNRIAPTAAPPDLGALFPQGHLEMFAGMLVAITAGFCEEVMFRGYLQQQFGRIARNGVIGVVLQAVTFGVAHGYQGPKVMALIAAEGVMFGAFAYWRNSLRPGMLAHALQDSVAMLAHLV